MEQPVDNLTMALAATAELCGTQLSKPAAFMLRQDLGQYPEHLILGALARCRKELKGRLTVHEILSRVDDGRPGADEAWSLLAWDEELTSVIPAEANDAQGQVRSAYNGGDKTGARFAFKDTYNRLVNEARERMEPVRWIVSEGYDKHARAAAVREAVARGRLSPVVANRILPPEIPAIERSAIPADVKKQIASLIKPTPLLRAKKSPEELTRRHQAEEQLREIAERGQLTK